MPRNLKTVVAVSALIGGLLTAPALYAHGTGGGMMGGMMQGRQGNMMGQGGMMEGMMGMMNMMREMSGMMEDCSAMMQGMGGAQRPNEQWRDREPEQPQPEGDAG
jgi:hypothetical protein